MRSDELLSILQKRPWRSLVLVLASGDRYVVGHPEHLAMTENLGVLLGEHGLVAYFNLDDVVAVEPARNGARRKG